MSGEEERAPPVDVVFYRDDDGSVPLLKWIDELQPKQRAKCLKWIEILKHYGHDLRRPEADYLRDGIYELRVRFQRVNYKILYFFYRDRVVVLTHGLKKEREVPSRDIDSAVNLKRKFEANPP